MPLRDGTGPAGMGPKTGLGLGGCETDTIEWDVEQSPIPVSPPLSTMDVIDSLPVRNEAFETQLSNTIDTINSQWFRRWGGNGSTR